MRPCATSLRLNAMCCMPGDLEVVDIGGAALDQTRILAALDALADELRQHLWQDWSDGHNYLFFAACWMALTMC